jgi:hypothetical protein
MLSDLVISEDIIIFPEEKERKKKRKTKNKKNCARLNNSTICNFKSHG